MAKLFSQVFDVNDESRARYRTGARAGERVHARRPAASPTDPGDPVSPDPGQ